MQKCINEWLQYNYSMLLWRSYPVHVLTLLDIITVNKALLWELKATNRTVAWNKINRVWMTCVLSRIKVQCNHNNNLNLKQYFKLIIKMVFWKCFQRYQISSRNKWQCFTTQSEEIACASKTPFAITTSTHLQG